MARFLTVLLLTALTSYIAIVLAGWWAPMLLAFAIVLVAPMRSGTAFIATGAGAALACFIMALRADMANDHILSTKMAVLFFHLHSSALMLAVTALTGFITAGLGGLTASLLRRLTNRKAPAPQA